VLTPGKAVLSVDRLHCCSLAARKTARPACPRGSSAFPVQGLRPQGLQVLYVSTIAAGCMCLHHLVHTRCWGVPPVRNEELYHDLGPGGPTRPSSAPAGARRSASVGALRSPSKEGGDPPMSPASHTSQKEELPPYKPPFQHVRVSCTGWCFGAHLNEPGLFAVFVLCL
jgi:hypothetical protein